jgi:hypothetical protein
MLPLAHHATSLRKPAARRQLPDSTVAAAFFQDAAALEVSGDAGRAKAVVAILLIPAAAVRRPTRP